MVFLETPRLILRDYTLADEEEYYQLKTDEKTMERYMRDIMPHSREEAHEEFAGILKETAARTDVDAAVRESAREFADCQACR